MACSKPWYSPKIKDFRGNLVPLPCRSCLCCRVDNLNYWISRAKYEHNNSSCSAFVTFTYDEDNVRYTNGFETLSKKELVDRFGDNSYKEALQALNYRQTLVKEDFHKFIDTIRHRLKKMRVLPPNVSRKFSFIASGEYGDQFGRPHYHCVFFGLDFQTCRSFLLGSWKLGSIDVKPVNDGCIRYVLKYLSKQSFGIDKDLEYFDFGITPPFVTMSKGFGSGLFKDNADVIRETNMLKIGSKKYIVPPYWKNKYINMDVDFQNELIERRNREQFEQWNLNGRHNKSVYYDKLSGLDAREKDLLAKDIDTRVTHTLPLPRFVSNFLHLIFNEDF